MIRDIQEKQREFFLSGGTRNIQERKAKLMLLKRILQAHEMEIADAVYKDFGKSYFEVRQNELGLVYAEITKVMKRLHKWARPYKPATSLVNLPGKSRVYPVPYGNTLVIAPWNYPVQLALIPVVSAIAAGNTVILKPSEITAHTAALLEKLINEHMPPELLFVQVGGIAETRELLQMKFNKIFFTGSTRVGKVVMKAAAEHLTPVSLELGGKNPVIVMPDCDIKMTAKRLVWGKFHNGGQACVAPDHIYVHERIEEELLQEVKKNIEKLFNGGACSSEAYPRVVNKANFARLLTMIDKDKVFYGGRFDEDHLCIEPTVLRNVSREDPVMQEEVFGPIMSFLTYDNLDVLLNKISREESPLAFYIFTRNRRLAWKLQKEFRSGGGMINDTVVHFINANTPFGGIGESGMGSYHGKSGFEDFSHRKTVLSKPTWFELWVKYPPYTRTKLQLIKSILR